MKFNVFLGGVVLIVVIVVAGILGTAFTVETGEVAIVSRLGKVQGIKTEGLNFKTPFIDSKEIMVVRNSVFGFNGMSVSTKDMQTITLDIKIQIAITDPEKVYRNFKMNYYDNYINPRVNEIVQSSISKYTIEEFVSQRQQLSEMIFKELQAEFQVYGFLVSNVSIVNHDFSIEYERAIENKKIAEQKVDTAKFEQEKLRVENENRIKIEIAKAESRVKLAQYELEEKKIRAMANKVEADSLNDRLIKKMEIEKWDGVLPSVVSDSPFIINKK